MYATNVVIFVLIF